MTFWRGPLRSADALQVDLNDNVDESSVVVVGLVFLVSNFCWFLAPDLCMVQLSTAFTFWHRHFADSINF